MMPKQVDSDVGISEYDLASYLCKEFDVELKSEQEYLERFKSFSKEKEDGSLEVQGREEIPYQNGFDTDDGEFLFLEEVELDKKANKIVMKDKKRKVSDELHLITSKSKKSLNSQFKREEFVYLHSSMGFSEDEEVCVNSETGSVRLKVKHNEDLREDCVLIYSGTKGVNNLTSSKHSYEGKCAIYQENKVKVDR